MKETDLLSLSLTGDNSHSVKIPVGQGSFSIGALDMSPKHYDVLADKNASFNWAAFDKLTTPAGSYWPRFLYYCGNDKGFIKWSENRPIEDFEWTPQTATSTDFTSAQINRLTLRITDFKTILKLGAQNYFSITGNLELFEPQPFSGKIPRLAFYPDTSKTVKTPYSLPTFDPFKDAQSISIGVRPTGQPFDCSSLLQFTNLKHLTLSGNLTNLDALKQHPQLTTLAIRYAPNLFDLPNLDFWNGLTSFIGWNIEEATGKRLRKELRQLVKERQMDYSSVSKLRKSIWFTSEYGLPFSGWQKKSERVAVKAYKSTVEAINDTTDPNVIKAAIVSFVETINQLPNIETSEREDVFIGIQQLIDTFPQKLDRQETINWFDDRRDF